MDDICLGGKRLLVSTCGHRLASIFGCENTRDSIASEHVDEPTNMIFIGMSPDDQIKATITPPARERARARPPRLVHHQ